MVLSCRILFCVTFISIRCGACWDSKPACRHGIPVSIGDRARKHAFLCYHFLFHPIYRLDPTKAIFPHDVDFGYGPQHRGHLKYIYRIATYVRDPAYRSRIGSKRRVSISL